MSRSSAEILTCYYEVEPDGQVERVYPCRCGQVHRGDYAAYDYGHHTCYHFDDPLVIDTSMGNTGPLYQALCPLCGAAFIVEFIRPKEDKE